MQEWLLAIEQELQKVLPPQIDNQWASRIAQTPQLYQEPQLFGRIIAPASDLVYRGGKRWRPLLMLLNAKMLGSSEAVATALPLTPLVELPHNGSLIVDDIEDNSDVRRGEPAVHTIWGIDISINAANLLYYLPTVLIDESACSPQQKLRLYQTYARYMRKIHLGQGMDIVWHNQKKSLPSLEAYEAMCRMKTGCLAAMGAQFGAIIATEDEQSIQDAASIGESIGLFFQMMDDIINLERGNPGKMQGDDLVENKKSLPLILYGNKNEQTFADLHSLYHLARTSGYEAAQKEILHFIERLKSSGALYDSRRIALDLLDTIGKQIHRTYERSPERDYLENLLGSFAKEH
ncbi:MAG: polyprenyl synthetase family protein [Sphaerochaetaceae bacterium]